MKEALEWHNALPIMAELWSESVQATYNIKSSLDREETHEVLYEVL